VLERPLGLGLHARNELAGRRIEAELAAAEDQAVGVDRLAVGADGRRGATGRDRAARHPLLRWVSAGRPGVDDRIRAAATNGGRGQGAGRSPASIAARTAS